MPGRHVRKESCSSSDLPVPGMDISPRRQAGTPVCSLLSVTSTISLNMQRCIAGLAFPCSLYLFPHGMVSSCTQLSGLSSRLRRAASGFSLFDATKKYTSNGTDDYDMSKQSSGRGLKPTRGSSSLSTLLETEVGRHLHPRWGSETIFSGILVKRVNPLSSFVKKETTCSK